MGLSPSRKREIRQLWDAAVTYCNLAKEIADRMPDECRQVKMELTAAEIAQYYEKAFPTDQTERCLNVLLAHLSSAAIRLCTIEERLGNPRNYLDSGTSQKRPSIWLNKHFGDFVHQLLRDNAAHIEKGTAKNKNRERLYRARQNVICDKRVNEIFNALQGVMTKFTRKLQKRGVKAVLPS